MPKKKYWKKKKKVLGKISKTMYKDGKKKLCDITIHTDMTCLLSIIDEKTSKIEHTKEFKTIEDIMKWMDEARDEKTRIDK